MTEVRALLYGMVPAGVVTAGLLLGVAWLIQAIPVTSVWLGAVMGALPGILLPYEARACQCWLLRRSRTGSWEAALRKGRNLMGFGWVLWARDLISDHTPCTPTHHAPRRRGGNAARRKKNRPRNRQEEQ